jgi:hypothetical protein
MPLRVMVNGEQHGRLYEENEEGAMDCLNAAVDVISPPQKLRRLFLVQFAQGQYADNGEQRVWIEEAAEPTN